MHARTRDARLRSVVAWIAVAVSLTTLPASPAPKKLEGIPRPEHVVVLILENQNFDDSWGPGTVATYLNTLRRRGVFADHYYATGHASLSNYIAMISGQPTMPHSGADCLPFNLWACVQFQSLWSGGRNLADQLEEKRVSWKGYMDGMPSPCFHADYSPTALPPDPYQGDSREPPARDYADRHNPFLYFDNIVGNDARCRAHVVPFPQIFTDMQHSRLPRFAFITPDTCHDGHDAPCSNGEPGGLISADRWMAKMVPPILRYVQKHNGWLLITFDENAFTDGPPIGCCTGGVGGLSGFGGRIGLIALGPGLKPGTVVTTAYDHMSLLRTIENAFGISEYLNNAGSARAMNDLFT